MSSIYVYQAPVNYYDARWSFPVNFNDGYNDGQPHYYKYVESGFFRDSDSPFKAVRFWAYNQYAYTNQQYFIQLGTTNDVERWSSQMKIGNTTMGSSGYQNWRVLYDGGFVGEVSIDLPTAEALVSAERYQMSGSNGNSSLPTGDDSRADFRALERKNSKATWSPGLKRSPWRMAMMRIGSSK